MGMFANFFCVVFLGGSVVAGWVCDSVLGGTASVLSDR